jgi:hypothetical protein
MIAVVDVDQNHSPVTMPARGVTISVTITPPLFPQNLRQGDPCDSCECADPVAEVDGGRDKLT